MNWDLTWGGGGEAVLRGGQAGFPGKWCLEDGWSHSLLEQEESSRRRELLMPREAWLEPPRRGNGRWGEGRPLLEGAEWEAPWRVWGSHRF